MRPSNVIGPIIKMVLLVNLSVYAQTQLLQSFIERNSIGEGEFGRSVSSLGDVNNDGYDDIVVGVPESSTGTGVAYIYFGGSAMDAVPDVTLEGEGENNHFGSSVSNAGDVNNDGYDDIIVGANDYHRAYIYLGGDEFDSTPAIILRSETANNDFAYVVSTAGDINNDGYDDVIIGAPAHNSNTGRVYVFFGGTAMDTIVDITLSGEGFSDVFGKSISAAGDINNDGYDDIIIGAKNYDSDRGRAYIYFGATSMDDNADVIMTGEITDNEFGISVCGAGDVNNDGYADVIVGATNYNSYTGRAYVYYGASEMDNTADVTMNGEGVYHRFGYTVSTAGDMNNDGFDDVIVGAWHQEAYVFLGSTDMDNIPDMIIPGEGGDDDFGSALSVAGDVNNDGYDDVVVGAHGYNSNTGRAYVYFGGLHLNSLPDVVMNGEAVDNFYGRSVAMAGDVNNDGFDDVIVGAHRYNTYTGRVYIYYGSLVMDSIADVIMTGTEEYENFGYSVAPVGDVNNDGYDDVIVGAFGFNNSSGRSYIFFGGSNMNSSPDVIMSGVGGSFSRHKFGQSVSMAGDVNNDGYDDVLVAAPSYLEDKGRCYIFLGGSSMNNVADVILTGEGTSHFFGSSIGKAGDLNNDGYADVIIGAPGYQSYTGRSYIYYGGGSMDDNADVILTGEGIFNYFGSSVSTAGDVNNDSYDDVIVGAYGYESNTGRSYIYYGGIAMNNTPELIMTGEETENFYGYSVSTAGDFNNDGFGDVIVGAYGKNTLTGTVCLYYGEDSMDITAAVIISGENENDYFGYSVSKAGDINGDSYDDIIVGAYGYPQNGKAYVYTDPSAPVSLKESLHGSMVYKLFQNSPNPFNPTTTVSYSLSEQTLISLSVFDIRGREIKKLDKALKSSGSYEVQWNSLDQSGNQVSTGVYFCRLQAGSYSETIKMVYLR
ncbi:MAG: FG-GAP repeat protein [Candidatus Marinimicrobia bacterium]|nr:FG-GAP repeat protein [Candidatus Neomarinimicrobiota bacterium]